MKIKIIQLELLMWFKNRDSYAFNLKFYNKTELTLTEQQNSVFDTINAHSKQGGLCVIAGEPGTGKTAIMGALQNLSKNKSIEVPTMSRTMHSYSNIIKLLLEAFKLDNKHSVKECESDILQEAFKLHS